MTLFVSLCRLADAPTPGPTVAPTAAPTYQPETMGTRGVFAPFLNEALRLVIMSPFAQCYSSTDIKNNPLLLIHRVSLVCCGTLTDVVQ